MKLFPAYKSTTDGDQWGYINKKGSFEIEPQYELAHDFQENGLAIVQVHNKNGVINTKGEYVVKPDYDYITQYSEGRATVHNEKGVWVIDEKGNILTSQPFDFISSYQQGRALYQETNEENNNVLYGYLDRDGGILIPAQYQSATDFQDGVAVVQTQEGQYQLIARDTSILYKYPYEYVGQYGQGMLAYQEEGDPKYGFIDKSGKVIIPPSFDAVQPFSEGRAVINKIEDYLYSYGLIDQKGNIILEPTHSDISRLGEKRIAVGKAIKEEQPYLGVRYAIADLNGNFLSDYRYQNVLPYEKGYASAHDDENTFFLNREGKIAQKLPVVPGQGTLRFQNSLIQANVDFQLMYLDRKGNVIWRPKNTIRLNNQFRVLRMKYKPNPDYLVYYPVVRGMEDTSVQKQVNDKLKGISQVKPIPSDEKLEYSYTGDFEIEFFKKYLVVVEMNGSQYYFGAAHPMPTKIYSNIDLVSGTFYELKDLFKEGAPYVKVISDIVEQQIVEQEINVFPDSYKGIQPDQPFYVNEESLFIYFPPYEITPYVAGFPTFEIPFSEIMDIIDTKGEFWLSFHHRE
ncbi:WG repeat-containing protein, partial [Pontibacillus marinus]|uniref:DUF3298 domain-containing protein n=1 Tax=Pontibacillus marinus BH030004 = DSM 16465 TaxID=1385511 RepID=A0A0A5HIT6_9BACI